MQLFNDTKDIAMKSRLCALSVLWLYLAAPSLSAAEIIVSPGVGTLADAIAAAAAGDTLVLRDGGYYSVSGLSVTINKSLTIRAQTRATDAVINMPINVNAPSSLVTVQGLTLRLLNLDAGKDIRILENTFLTDGIEATDYQSTQGDGTLVIIGNLLHQGNISTRSDNAYIAGNTLQSGQISSNNASAWIVGNRIYRSDRYAISQSGGAVGRILGNRVTCVTRSSGSNSVDPCVGSTASTNLYSLNILVAIFFDLCIISQPAAVQI